jgi:tetratricopeptide (TPR) repeat protein
MTRAFVDYYALLGVARTASRPEIEQAIKQGIRTWSKQTSRPELDKRQEAERKMQQLKEARLTLLDEGRRQRYDQQLATPVVSGGVVSAAPTSGEGWLALARHAMSVKDYRTAVRAAEEGQTAPGRSAEAWNIAARANSGLGRLDEAVFAAQRALQLDPNNPDHHYTLAAIFEQLGDWTNALRCYETLVRLDPGSDLPQIRTAMVSQASGNHTRAMAILERLYASGRDQELAGDYLAMALTDAAEKVPRVRDSDGYAITSPDEIRRMRDLLARAEQVTADPDLLAEIADTRSYVSLCAGREVIWRRMFGRWGVGYLVLALLLLFLASRVPDLRPLTVLVVVGGGVGLVLYARVPRWRLNRLTHGNRHVAS